MSPQPVPTTSPEERRGSSRFPIRQQVHYQVLRRRGIRESGWGQTINISSSGVLFTTTHRLPPRVVVELNIDWPAKLDNRLSLKLVARGCVVHSGPDYSAIEIDKHEFRIKGTSEERGA
jgi:hypothetical protein